MDLKKRMLSFAAAMVLLAGTTAAAAKEAVPGGKLNAPDLTASAAVNRDAGGYTSGSLLKPLSASKPAGELKKVTRGGYSFVLPAVWEIPGDIVLEGIQDVFGAKKLTGSFSGVAFMTFAQPSDMPAREDLSKTAKVYEGEQGLVTSEYLAAPAGTVLKISSEGIEPDGRQVKVTVYYPDGGLSWGIMAFTAGEDSAPTAEETAAYMAYTLRKAS